MKLLLDEMLSPTIAAELRRRGHDVEAISGSSHQGRADRAVMHLAREQGRAVMTNNVRDYRPLHLAAIAPGGPGDLGIIFMPGTYKRSKADIGRIADALEATLVACPGERDLADAETWLP